MSEEVWDRQFDLNLRSAFLGCKHALPYLRERETAAIGLPGGACAPASTCHQPAQAAPWVAAV